MLEGVSAISSESVRCVSEDAAGIGLEERSSGSVCVKKLTCKVPLEGRTPGSLLSRVALPLWYLKSALFSAGFMQ